MKKKAEKPTKKQIHLIDRATAYAQAVVSGEIVAGPFVRGACKRHLNDLHKSITDPAYPFFYDTDEAAKSIEFFEKYLRLNGGQFEGKPFLLLGWQDFIIGSLFGWKRKEDGTRRFRTAYIETPKGSGKSPLAAGIGLKGICADRESRAEIYAAGTFKEQAMVLFRDAIAFYDQSPELQKRLVASGTGDKRWKLAFPKNNSFFKVISSEKKGQSGPRPHFALLDEIHEHRDNTVIELIRAGFKFRRQPMMFMITNSGHDKTSVCWEYHDYGTKVASEQVQNDEFFAYICALDDEDFEDDKYLMDESLWIKVNPSLDAGLPGYDYIRSQIRDAKGMPSKMATVKRLCFCVWTKAENPAIGKDVWFACEDKNYSLDLLGSRRRCWGGLDLSAVNDLTSFALLFEPEAVDPFWRIKVWFWIPGVGLVQKADHDRVPYIAWRDAGYVLAIDRKTIEYEFIIPQIVDICRGFNVQKISFDRWNYRNFEKEVSRIGATLPAMVEFGQGFQSMGPAVKIFEAKLIGGTLRHDGNPCLTWNAANVVSIEDPAKNKKYDKSRSTGRIDGIIASVMACGIIEDLKPSGMDERAAKGEDVIRVI